MRGVVVPIASPIEPAWHLRHLRTPRHDGDVLAIPPLGEMPAALANNRAQIAKWDVPILGKPLAELRRLAREETLTAAAQFTRQLDAPTSGRDAGSAAISLNIDSPLIVGGHQPELFHAGVWAKNFVLDRLARATGGIGLHLIVDNDEVASTRLAVPIGSRDAPRIEQVSFDLDAGSTPWEEARLRDPELFRSFAERVATALSCWPIRPLLSDLWPAAVELAARVPEPRLSDLLTAVRREAERRAGLSNLELPISQLCETQAFAWFAASLLSDPHHTHSTYNAVVAEYRRVNRVRNRQRPVPDLALRADGWLELPFWLWRTGDTRRGRLLVRTSGAECQLANGDAVVASLRCSPAESLVEHLQALSASGWKLRPRALTMTLFARVFLADAFLHGIGGAKYDEMTDRLIARLFGVAPPSYLTVTATHHLPLGGWDVSSADLAELQHRLWDFDHNPERHMHTMSPLPPGEGDRRPGEGRAASDPHLQNPREADTSLLKSTSDPACLPHPSPLPEGEGTGAMDAEVAELLAEKQRLIAEQHTQDALDRYDPRRASRAENNQRRRRLREISQRLATLASETRSAINSELQSKESQLTANTVLQNREFSFCLFATEFAKFHLLVRAKP